MATIRRGLSFAAALAVVAGSIEMISAAEPQRQIVKMELQTGEPPTTDGVRAMDYRPQQWLYPSHRPQETLREQPKYKSEKPVFFAARYGDGSDTTFTIAIDESGGTGTGYDLAYVDGNNDNRIDETTERFPLRLGVSQRLTPLRVRLLVSAGGERVPYHFDFRAFEYSHDNYPGHAIHANATNPSYYVGEAILAGKRRKVAVADLSSNGLFNDPRKQDRYTGDSLYVDLNGDGVFAWSRISSLTPESQNEEFPYGRYVCIDGKWYSFTASPGGTSVEVASADSLMGTLAATELAELVVVESNDQKMELDFSKQPVRVLPGTCTIKELTLKAKDPAGNSWEIYTHIFPECQLKIETDQTARIPFGPPFRVAMNVARIKDDPSLAVTLGLTGARGEIYRCPQKDGKRLEAGFAVQDEQGRVVFSDVFEFT